MSTVSGVSTLSANTNQTSSRLPVQTLGQEDFLKLLVTQMTAQDPLSPQKDTDFIAQMAQFSALENSKTLVDDMSRLSDQQQFSQATSLLGQNVIVVDGKNTFTGTVNAIKLDKGIPKLEVNGKYYDLAQVVNVTPPPAPLSPGTKS
jgi:flagellar basal-body rod modification protein FlgD